MARPPADKPPRTPRRKRTPSRAPARHEGGSYSRGSKAVKVGSAFLPLAVAAIALAVPEPRAVSAPPESPPRMAAAAAPGSQPTPVPPASATPQCLSRYQIPLPVHEGEDVDSRQTLICRDSYVLSFNVDTRDPDWVMERISATELTGPATRRNNFGPDPAAQGTDATNADYLRTGFDRGHQAPAGDAKVSQRAMDDSFFFTNMAPQIGPGFNRGAWKFLEETVRGWVICGGHPELYVITGPIYGQNPSTIGANRVYVPREFFKIAYDPNSGHVVGFIMPNVRIGSRVDLQLYARSISDIEAATGLDFFSTFDQRRQTLLESDPGTAWGHTGACPGDGGD
jgi:endonuclease G, mitochondrial